MIEEIVYSNRDNTIELELSSNGQVIAHNAITRVQLSINGELIDSQDSPSYFDLTNAGKLILKLGEAALSPARYLTTLIVYDNESVNGLVWGRFVLVVEEE
jgi:hypothetical protein